MFSDFILSVLWPRKPTFTEMKTVKVRLYNQEEHKSGGAHIASLTARLICTPCTSSLHFMHKGQEAKLSKPQVSFHLKSLNHTQALHICTQQCKHTHASSHNMKATATRTPPADVIQDSTARDAIRAEIPDRQNGQWTFLDLSGGTLYKDRGLWRVAFKSLFHTALCRRSR